MSHKQLVNNYLNKLEQRGFLVKIAERQSYVKLIAKKLDLIHFDCPVVTIGGTNGKGSTITLLNTIYQAAGYKTACYTSPHIINFNERIIVDNKVIDDQTLLTIFTVIEQHDTDNILSYFEFTTLAALYFFRQQKAQVVLLEVGLGGRLDVTNIVENDVAVITNVNYDHQAILGDSREAIGLEKAGIFKRGKFAVFGESDIPQSVKHQAQACNSTLFCAGKDFSYEKKANYWNWYRAGKSIEQLAIPQILLQNAATALMVIDLLQEKRPIDIDLVKQIIADFSVMGRSQLIQYKHCSILLDVAHNPQAVQNMADLLGARQSVGRLLVLFAILADKDIEGCIEPMLPLAHQWHIASLHNNRGCSADELETILKDYNVDPIKRYNTVTEAFSVILNEATEDDLIVIYGSFHTVGDILSYLRDEVDNENTEG